MKNPTTEAQVVGHADRQDNEKFASVRQRAKIIERDRYKSKTKKEKPAPAPKYKIDEHVILLANRGYRDRHYILIELLDILSVDNWGGDKFTYYGVVRKVTDEKQLELLGHLVHFNDRYAWSSGFESAGVPADSPVRWLE